MAHFPGVAKMMMVADAMAAGDDPAERLQQLFELHHTRLYRFALRLTRRDEESSINELAYQLLKMDDDPAGAVKVFRANVEVHPESWQVWDSLADGLEGAENKEEAKRSREHARQLREQNSP